MPNGTRSGTRTAQADPTGRIWANRYTRASGNKQFTIAFSPEGKTLVSAGAAEIILWDLDPKDWIEKACQMNLMLPPVLNGLRVQIE